MDNKELELAGIDVKELTARFMNNTKLMKMMLGKFLEDQTCLRLKAAVESGDMKEAEFACHALKGVCGNMALKSLFAALQEQLSLFRSGELTRAADMTPKILDEYEKALVHVRLWLKVNQE